MSAVVPFARIPNQSNLFLSYLELSPEALSFYQRPPTLAALTELAGAYLTDVAFPRTEITAILKRQNERFRSDVRSLQYIEDLVRPDCFAVLTGQQVGLFTGPLYTIYKAFTAIRIAEELRARGTRAVPVFWLDTDDHDLAEVTHCSVLGADSLLRVMDYRQLLFGDLPESTRPVGSIEFPQTIRQAIEDYLAPLHDTEWRNSMRSRMESAYSIGSNLADAFGQLMAQLFAGYGLVLFDPRDADAKQLASSVFQEALKGAEEIHSRLSVRTRELEAAKFHSQVSILEGSTALFLHEQGERKALVREDSSFVLKGTEHRYGLNQLLQVAASSPERFSPNVLLRPVVQDTMFPTVCYVGGPGEIAYFAQAEALYRWFGRPMPVIWPRVSFTLLDSEVASAMARHGLALEDCFKGKEHILENLLKASDNARGSATLAGMQQDLAQGFDELRPAMTAAEASLGPALDTVKRKVFHHLEGLRAKCIQLEARQNGELLKRTEMLANTCYPNGNLQERELGICQFLSRYGPKILDTINSSIRIDSFVHDTLILSA